MKNDSSVETVFECQRCKGTFKTREAFNKHLNIKLKVGDLTSCDGLELFIIERIDDCKIIAKLFSLDAELKEDAEVFEFEHDQLTKATNCEIKTAIEEAIETIKDKEFTIKEFKNDINFIKKQIKYLKARGK
ncbi:MAG: hypothetical protein AABY32_00960 [Nanoarchaeota archaeon]